MTYDITFCKGADCPVKEKCYRYINNHKISDNVNISVFSESPFINKIVGGICAYFRGNDYE